MEAMDGVFQHLVDNAAFIDRVDVSVDGHKRRHPRPPVVIVENLAIGGMGRIYARSAHFNCHRSGNRGEVMYGACSHYPTAPDIRLILHSARTPLTSAQLCTVADSVLRKNFRSYFSAVELTFDVWCTEIHEIGRRLIVGTRKLQELADHDGHKTIYLRSATSPWQLRVYDKAEGVVRVEFVLRLPFLRQCVIQHPSDLLKLREIPLLPEILPPCPLRNLLRKMQLALIW